MITVVHAAWIADRLWWINRPKFHRECEAARELGITLLELIQRRIARRLELATPYEAYEIQDLESPEGKIGNPAGASPGKALGPGGESVQKPSQVRLESWDFSSEAAP